MKKSNRGQTVGNLSTRGGVHPKQAEVRRKSDESLITEYQVARMLCTKNPNHKNRAAVDGLQARLIRRQKRAIFRARKAQAERQAKMVRAAEAKLTAAQAVVDAAKSGHASLET